MADWNINFRDDIYEENNDEVKYKIRPRFIDENFENRHTQFEIQNEWKIQDLTEFLLITKKLTFGFLI